MIDEQFYGTRRLTDQNPSNLTNVNLQKYVLDPIFRSSLLNGTAYVAQPNINVQNDLTKVISPEGTSMNTTRELNTN